MKKLIVMAVVIPLLLGNEGGCGDEAVRLVLPEIPDTMLRCMPDPLKGKTAEQIRKEIGKLNDKQIAIIFANYKTAHADCQAKVDDLRELYYGWKARVQ